MDVLLWVLHDAAQDLAHWFLVLNSFLVSVDGVRRREQGQGRVDVSRMAPLRVLLYHEASDWTALNDILRDDLQALFEVFCIVSFFELRALCLFYIF